MNWTALAISLAQRHACKTQPDWWSRDATHILVFSDGDPELVWC